MKLKKVLFVDDEVEFHELLIGLLADVPHEALFAKNGFEAMEKIKSHPDISLIVSDYRMPRMNGVEFARALAEENIQIPFIFFSGVLKREMINELVPFGVHGFIEKTNFQGLKEHMVESLGSRQNEDINLDDLIKKI